MTAQTPDEGIRQYRFTLPPGATDILLVRHGESQPVHPDRPFPMMDGQGDPPLDPRGELEAQRVAERLAGLDLAAVYVTPLRRTQQTAAPLLGKTGLQARVERDLREVHLGEWEGPQFRLKVDASHPLARRMFDEGRWDVIPGPEPQEAFHDRVRSAIGRIAAAHRDQRIVAVTHGGVIGAVVALATGSHPFAFIGADNASITHLVVTDERWLVRRFNDTGHLVTDLDAPPEPLI